MHHQPMLCAKLGCQFVNRQIGLRRDPVLHPTLTPVSLPYPGLPCGFGSSAPVSRLSRTISLTNLIETHSRRAASVCVFPCSTSPTARSRSSTGCGLPISDPQICHKKRESQKQRLGNPESDQGRHALADHHDQLLAAGNAYRSGWVTAWRKRSQACRVRQTCVDQQLFKSTLAKTEPSARHSSVRHVEHIEKTKNARSKDLASNDNTLQRYYLISSSQR